MAARSFGSPGFPSMQKMHDTRVCGLHVASSLAWLLEGGLSREHSRSAWPSSQPFLLARKTRSRQPGRPRTCVQYPQAIPIRCSHTKTPTVSSTNAIRYLRLWPFAAAASQLYHLRQGPRRSRPQSIFNFISQWVTLTSTGSPSSAVLFGKHRRCCMTIFGRCRRLGGDA